MPKYLSGDKSLQDLLKADNLIDRCLFDEAKRRLPAWSPNHLVELHLRAQALADISGQLLDAVEHEIKYRCAHGEVIPDIEVAQEARWQRQQRAKQRASKPAPGTPTAGG